MTHNASSIEDLNYYFENISTMMIWNVGNIIDRAFSAKRAVQTNFGYESCSESETQRYSCV